MPVMAGFLTKNRAVKTTLLMVMAEKEGFELYFSGNISSCDVSHFPKCNTFFSYSSANVYSFTP